MADYIPITKISSGSSNAEIKAIASSDAIGHIFVGEYDDVTSAAGDVRLFLTTALRVQIQTDSEREFERQKQFFDQILPLFLEQYRGRFVASRDGRIVDSDDDFVALTHRFFENFGDVPVYITKIGHDDGISLDTPFFD